MWHLSDQLSNNSFYVIETNYDRRAAPPDFDDRRYPAENCLDAVPPPPFQPPARTHARTHIRLLGWAIVFTRLRLHEVV